VRIATTPIGSLLGIGFEISRQIKPFRGVLPMKTFALALMLAVTAVSGVVVASQSAFAGGAMGHGGDGRH
jgi:hypothetical protein